MNVRVIKGLRHESTEQERKELETGAYLSDVKNQLEAIPYSQFRVIDSTEKHVHIGEQGAFTIIDGEEQHALSVEPTAVDGQLIQVVVDWNGPNGESLLSTKLGVVRGKTVVVGTDEDSDSSTIMCIRVDCG